MSSGRAVLDGVGVCAAVVPKAEVAEAFGTGVIGVADGATSEVSLGEGTADGAEVAGGDEDGTEVSLGGTSEGSAVVGTTAVGSEVDVPADEVGVRVGTVWR